MKKRLLNVLILFVLILSVLPTSVGAETLDTQRECTMTLHYSQDGTGFSDLEISVYRVAKANANGTFTLTDPYNAFPVNIYGIRSQTEWDLVASTFRSFILTDGVAPTRTGKTNSSGTVVFDKLQTGLYLVMGTTAENETGVYEFNTFMIYVPTPGQNATFNYNVEASPKCIKYVPKTAYKVVKLWKDTGYAASRPKEVTVEIYKDGTLWETVKLNTANNWTYTWRVPENQDGKWTVTEKEVPKNYSVTIAEGDGQFTVTNSRKPDPEDPPKTGDMFPLWPAVLTMCISGSLLVVLGIYWLRKRK
jgi:hypothetical protein